MIGAVGSGSFPSLSAPHYEPPGARVSDARSEAIGTAASETRPGAARSSASSGGTEEIAFRGVLMERVEEWTGRAWLAVLATVVLFVGGHVVHYGLLINAVQAVVTVLFALLFLWRRDLTAPIVLHAVIDGWALLAVPALGL